jgi:hypothetical protein
VASLAKWAVEHYGDESERITIMTTRGTEAALPAWNRVVTPHPDILEGQLSMDTYAVNLGQVIENAPGVRLVYRDARAFFEATYLTKELHHILTDVTTVLAGGSGNRVLQLRTPFGGGKTHTLLALYHLTHSRHLLKDLDELQNLPDPGPARIAVISGIMSGAADGQTKYQTLWGKLAWQLGGEDGYGLVLEQDRQRIAPGGDILAQLIGDTPTLLLLDEVLVYVENAMGVTVGESNLGRQTLTFLQRLTEVIAASPHAAMIYSLQASEQEAGGNTALLGILGKLVQRINAIREPVSGDEVLRVVQRRLFSALGDERYHHQVAHAYAENYRSFLLAGGTATQEAHQKAEQLRNRILMSYPFHPALLDLMRERWSGLPSYQRTRGALQFLATSVRALWASNMQTQPLLGPGDVMLKNSEVRTTFLAQVGEQTQYDAVLQADLIGPMAGAASVDTLLVRESPHLQTFLPGTRIATTALFYSFDGRSQPERGVYEHELLSSCLTPGLNRHILQTALHDLNERLLYLHRRDHRYRFETQPNLNKLIIDEYQRRDEDEVELRLRKEFSKAVGNERGAVVWPHETQDVRDRLPEFQIVYLSPAWLDTHPEDEQQEKGMRRYIENCGNGNRRYRNGLSLAVPDGHMVESARNAVRLILTLEILQNQSKERQLTPQQTVELAERQRNAEKELKGAISQMYPIVYTPQSREQGESPYVLDPLRVQSYSQAPQLHTRIKEALSNRAVWSNIQPSKLLSLTKLQEAAQLDQQYYPVESLTACFFSYYNWTHIWNEDVLRDAIKVGIKNGTIAYVANARKNEQEQLMLPGPASSTVHLKKEISAREIDMGSGAYLLSAALAQQLLMPLAPTRRNDETDLETANHPPDIGWKRPEKYANPYVKEGSEKLGNGGLAGQPGGQRTLGGGSVASGRGGKTYRLHLRATPDQLFEVLKSLHKLGDYSSTLDIHITATTKTGQSFVKNTLHNLIVEPMVEESDVVILEEQVEE